MFKKLMSWFEGALLSLMELEDKGVELLENGNQVQDFYEGDNGELNFGVALQLLKAGQRVARAGWNGKGIFLFLVPGSTFKVNRAPLLGIYPEGTEINYHAHIDMKTATGEIVPWLASQTDVLATDWVLVS